MPRADWLLVAAGAVAMCLAYPPFHLLIPSFISLAPAVLLLERGKNDERALRRHLVQGFWFGLAANGLVLYWMIVALWHFTSQAALGYAATIVVLGLWYAVLFGAAGWMHRRGRVSWIIVFPVAWTALEWIIGHLGDVRFPWLGLGTSLTGFPVLIQGAELMGARGITLLLALANTALAMAWIRRGRGDVRWWSPVVVVASGVVITSVYGMVRMRTIPLRIVGKVAAIQPNVGFDDKWERSRVDSIFRDLIDLSTDALTGTHPDLVVWPEAAVPGYFASRPRWDLQTSSLAARAGVPILAGGLDYRVRSENDTDLFNAAFLFDSTGRRDRQAPYYKRYLVPITERVPFVNPAWFGALRFWGSFAIGTPGTVFRTSIGDFGVFICYESAFEDLPRDYRRRGADFLVNITNDAWFGRTSAPYQHAAHLVMRAIETRAGIVRAANTGVSEFVDPLGRASDQTPLYVRTMIARDLVTSDVIPLYVRVGDWVGWLVLAVTAVLLVRTWRATP